MSLNQMKSIHQRMVEELMFRAEQELPVFPSIPSEDIRLLRAKLILEETMETIAALGFHVVVERPSPSLVFDDIRLEPMPDGTCDIEQVIDGCCDIRVVTTGTLSAFGIPDEPFQMEVDENNLMKFGPGGYRREDGKWVKPPNHKPPQIQKLLTQLKWYS